MEQTPRAFFQTTFESIGRVCAARHTRGGLELQGKWRTRACVRTAHTLHTGYGLLLSKGKPYKVAVTACMRKLLTILNARMRDYFAENGIQTA